MVVVTGAYGFIGSCMVQDLNDRGMQDVVVVDDFYQDRKEPNLAGKAIREWLHRDIFISWFEKNAKDVDVVVHLGAKTDTISTDTALFDQLNLNYSKSIWNICAAHDIPLVYASSAATYGDGAHGYRDDHAGIRQLVPMNAYAVSKHQFDLWALEQKHAPPRWYGLKFFNVYGPNEYHKERMASVVWHGFRQISETGELKLFQSHRAGIAHGHQQRDFIYVRDVTDICAFFMTAEVTNGIYNVGTGMARTFLDLGKAIFTGMGVEEKISFIPTPESIRDTYQYYTQAEMHKLRSAGYQKPFKALEQGVHQYVRDFLIPGLYL